MNPSRSLALPAVLGRALDPLHRVIADVAARHAAESALPAAARHRGAAGFVEPMRHHSFAVSSAPDQRRIRR